MEAMLQSMQRRSRRRELAQATEETGTDPAIVASGASVVLALYQYFVRGNRDLGIFVGLWAPTILAFASYFEQTRMSRRVERAMGGNSSIRETVEQMMGSR